MAVEASGEHSALEQFTEYLSDGGDQLPWSAHTKKIQEIFEARIDHLNEDVQSLLDECDKKEFQTRLKGWNIDPYELLTYVKETLVLKTSVGNKVTSVAKSNFLVDHLEFDPDRREPWPINHLSKKNQARLVAFFETGAIPTDLADEEWVELVREAEKLDIPHLFNPLIEEKIPLHPESLDEGIEFYRLMLEVGSSSVEFDSLENLRNGYEIEIVKAALAGETIEDRLLNEIRYFEFPRSADFSASIELLKKCPNATTIVAEGLNQEQINLLAKCAPQCVWLDVSEGTFETLPEFAHLTELTCVECLALTMLFLPKATKVACTGCTSLAELHLPQAIEVVCNRCPVLTELSFPHATDVICASCPALTKLSAPRATNVNCEACLALFQLVLPLAINVNCKGCSALTKLTLPQATEVYCASCPALTNLSLPQAAWVYCGWCRLLTNLSLPKATKVSCVGCAALTYFLAPEPAKLLYGDAQAGIIAAARLRASEGPPPEGVF